MSIFKCMSNILDIKQSIHSFNCAKGNIKMNLNFVLNYLLCAGSIFILFTNLILDIDKRMNE